MRPSQIISMSGVILVGSIMMGCAADIQQQGSIDCGSNYTCLTNAAFQYRQQAAQLSTLAERYETEADLKTKELGNNAEEAQRQRALAKQYWTEAQQADELARQYRNRLPHNMVY